MIARSTADVDRAARRTALVTGATSGIGLATVRHLHAEGWTVIATDRTAIPLPPCEQLLPVVLDVTDEHAVEQLVERSDPSNGGIDAAVACAGIVRNAPVVHATTDDFRLTQEVNVVGTFLICRAVVRQMLRHGRGGSLVTISSVSGLRGGQDRIAYAASKGAVVALTRALAVELGPHGIRANCLAPGATETPLAAIAQPPDVQRAVIDAVPLGRYARPEETASVIALLAGPRSSFVTGQTWGVDRGQTAYPGWRIQTSCPRTATEETA